MKENVSASAEENFIDPICGMTVAPGNAAGSLEFGGKSVYFCSQGCVEKFKKQLETAKAQPAIVQLGRKKVADSDFETHVDPVCKMIVKADTAAAKFEHNGAAYYFCAVSCLNKFRQNPENFLQKESKPRYC